MRKLMLSLFLGLMLIGMTGFVAAQDDDNQNCLKDDNGDIYTKGRLTSDIVGVCKSDVNQCLDDIDDWCSVNPNYPNGLVEYTCNEPINRSNESSWSMTDDVFENIVICQYGCDDGACLHADDDDNSDDDNPSYCPQYMSPAPGWCGNGTVLPGLEKENGCIGPPRCSVQNKIREAITTIRSDIKEQRELRLEVRHDIKESLKEGEEINFSEARLTLKRIDQEILALQMEKIRILTRLKLNNEGNASELRTQLSNGRNATIKIMPNVASERALARLRLKRCNETRNCSIELKEVGQGNKTRLVYEARARKTFRIWGFIKNHEEVRTRIDAETGEVVATKRPWWAWMASEEDEADEIEE